MVKFRTAMIGVCAAVALAAVPVAPASAHGYYRHGGGGLIFGLAALSAAVVVGAATIATAPFRAIAAQPAYAPQPVYYAPPAPVYAAPPPQYYAPPQAYYAPAPGYYYAPRGYYYGR